jgi:hypothetical protein
MAILSLIENGIVNCFFPSCLSKKEKKENERLVQERFESRLKSVGSKYNIAILPVISDYEIENLYPVTDQVHKWNILIVGSDKTYIHASIYDLDIPETENLVNNRGTTILSTELNEFFDPIFDNTLKGRKLQFLIIWRKTTYLVNTYPLENQSNKVVGAIMFVRAYELLPKMSLDMSPNPKQQVISM